MWIAAWSRDPTDMNTGRINLNGNNGEEREAGRRCGEKNEAPMTAFRRSSLMMRSPPASQALCLSGSASGTNAKDAEVLPVTPTIGDERGVFVGTGTEGISSSSSRTDSNGTCADRSQPVITRAAEENAMDVAEENISGVIKGSSPRLELIHKMRRMEEEPISQCKITLGGMQRAINRQKNISNEVKLGVSKMAELLDVMMNYRRTWKTAEGERTFSSLRRNAANLQLTDAPTPKTANPKRAANSPVVPTQSKKPRTKIPSVGEDEDAAIERVEGDWQTVTRKDKKRRKKLRKEKAKQNDERKLRPKPMRTEAIMVKPAEGRSYAEVLGNLKSNMVLDDSAKIRSIRKTMTGAILLEFGKGEKVGPDLVKQLRNTVRETASIAELRPTATVEIRDLDSLTITEDVETAVRKELANQEEWMRIKITAPNVREQVRAFITLPAESAERLIRVGNIRIGFIRAKVRRCEEIRRCYRCLENGHSQSNCSGTDRRNVCIRCGESGHRMKECKSAPRCILCVDAKRSQIDHVPGSRRCQQIRKL